MGQDVALAALVAALAAVAAIARAQTYGVYGAEQFFTLEWSTGQSQGQPVISGYVVNHYGMGVSDRDRKTI